MCGIYGLLDETLDEAARSRLADAMAEALRPRGPDHHGRYDGPRALLGMTRLAIVDLAGGNQPIFNEDGSRCILYNGEVYNHAALREELEARGHRFRTRSDTETVLHAFEEYGSDALLRLNGMFAFAVYEPAAHRLFLARDRLGIKPLYLAERPGGLAYASEAKALLPCLPSVRPDWTAIQRYFAFGYVPAPDAPFEGVRKLPPGQYAWYEEGALRVERYWEPVYGVGEAVSPEEAAGRVETLLSEAVRKELMADVPLGIFLSGGLDSAAVAVYARRHTRGPLHSFGLRFDEATHDESAESRLVAEHLGITHHEVPFGPATRMRALARVADVLDEPFADATVLPLLTLAEATRRELTVVLTGWGGDELFAGYPTYRAHRLARWYRALPRPLAAGLVPYLVARLPVSDRYMSFEFKAKRFVRGADQPPEIQHLLWMGYFDGPGREALFTPEVLAECREEVFAPVRRLAEAMTERDRVSRIQHLDARTFLEGNGFFQADRMTMAASLEARVPLLNNDLLEYVCALPRAVKMPGGRPKGLLRRVLAPYLPPSILRKPKKGFGPPTAAWMRGGPFLDLFTRLLSPERIRRQGMFRYETVHRLLDDHRARKADHGRELWAMLSFQLWYERFVEGALPGELEA